MHDLSVYLSYFSRFAVCPCFVYKKRVKVKYDCNRQCKDFLTNFSVFRAMLVQNVVRRVAQAPALARAFTSTVPKPSNTPARKQIWQFWWCIFVIAPSSFPALSLDEGRQMILKLYSLSLRVCQDQGEAEGLEGWQWPPGSRGDQIWPKPICQTYSCPNLRVSKIKLGSRGYQIWPISRGFEFSNNHSLKLFMIWPPLSNVSKPENWVNCQFQCMKFHLPISNS